jgi:hypothetical protein
MEAEGWCAGIAARSEISEPAALRAMETSESVRTSGTPGL